MKGITVLVLTFNEAPNIARTLSRVAWADDIVVVDSDSTDGTREIAARQPRVRVVEHAYISQAEKWTFGLTQTGISTEWVLALDADYLLSEELVREIEQLSPEPDVAGYEASFVYCVGGRPLRSGVYPPVVVLYRRDRASYLQDGHTQRVQVRGTIKPLAGRILHDDRKPLAHWVSAQARAARLEAEKLKHTPAASLHAVDQIRRLIVIAPPAMFLYCLIGRGGILDGWRGVFYAFQRAIAEALLSLYLIEASNQPE